MKTYQKIAEETGTTVAMVTRAMADAEKSLDTFNGTYARWFVCSMGYGDWNDRYCHADGRGNTREEAVIDALQNKPWMFK